MTSHSNFYKLTLLILSVLFAQSIYAIPQEALNACSGLSQGNSCSIQTRTEVLTGSCLTIESQLACVPGETSDPTSNEQSETNSESTNDTQTNDVEDTNSININSSFDRNTNILTIPIVAVNNTSYYQVTMLRISNEPTLLELTELVSIDSSEQVSATYDGNTLLLSIPILNINGNLYSAQLKRDISLPGYQFELVSFLELNTYQVVDTGQSNCYNSSGYNVSCDNSGQDGEYNGNQASYTDNGDGTITDNVTGLIWQQSPDSNEDGTINSNDKLTQAAAESYCSDLVLAEQSDWRLPDIKTMYSLIDFSGEDVSSYTSSNTSGLNPFIDSNYFAFAYGDTSVGERIIDVQYATSTLYVSTTMNGDETMFGVNMADGRIKGYGMSLNNNEKTFIVQCVRGNEIYGNNNFTDNNDQTISDIVTGLMWEQNDSQSPMNWDDAISQCENSTTANYTNWRLPNAKELQSIVDYTRSPDTTSSAAINAAFNATSFTNEAGQTDWGSYWSSTTHKNMASAPGSSAVYVAFGRALGYMNNQWLDVHGAGAQRSDPKVNSGYFDNSFVIVTDENGNEAITHGPQGDLVRINNYVRCVR